MTPKETARAARRRRHRRVLKKVSGTAQRPRLAVFRSLKHTYAQVIDDTRGHTLAQAATLEPDIRGQVAGKNKSSQAELVGDLVAKRVISQGVKSVVFDRAGYKYHGRVKALAEAARKVGLEF